jgi:hypothetical protein
LVWFALAAGILFSFPILSSIQKHFFPGLSPEKTPMLSWVQNAFTLMLFVAGIIVQAGTNYLPFIYGEF